jgi:hypothetical protein
VALALYHSPFWHRVRVANRQSLQLQLALASL